MAKSGGCKKRPTTSLGTDGAVGSGRGGHASNRSGRTPCASHTRRTVEWLTPAARPTARVLDRRCCIVPPGAAARRIARTCSSERRPSSIRGAEDSSTPRSRIVRKRRRQRAAVCRPIPNAAAISRSWEPSAAARTIRERTRRTSPGSRRRDHRSRWVRSSGLSTTRGATRTFRRIRSGV
jgi:hypothetical protein